MRQLEKSDFLGVILAGGLSRRMGGVEKSFLELSNAPLIKHSINRLSAQLDPIVINANGDPARFKAFDLPVEKDPIDGFLGPLAGILAGMKWASKTHPNSKYMVSIASDTPFFPENFVAKGIALLNAQEETQKPIIVLAQSNGRRHPVFGFWPIELQHDLQDFLTHSPSQKVMLFVEKYQLIEMPFENLAEVDPFFNINTEEDLTHARTLMKRLTGV